MASAGPGHVTYRMWGPELPAVTVEWTVIDAKNDCINNQHPACGPDIETIGGTAFNYYLASGEVFVVLGIQIGEYTGLLEATLEDINFSSPDNVDPWAGHDMQGTLALVAAEEPLQEDA